METELAPRGLIVSARRALRIMEVVAEAGDGITAKAIARRAGLKLSTTYQLINTLVHDGYLVRLAHAGGFGLGYKLFELPCHAEAEFSALPAISRVLRDLHPAARAPLYFTVFRDTEIVIADVADSGRYPRAREIDVGVHEAPHASAYGRLMLALISPGHREAGLGDVRMTGMAGRTAALTRVGQSCGALESGQFQPGLTCLAVPVCDGEGQVRGAVAASAPAGCFQARRLEIEGVVRVAAARVTRIISVAGGGTPPPALS